MFGCCKNAMQLVFMDTNGNLDPTYLKENYPEDSVVVVVEDTTSDLAKWIFDKEGKYPNSTKVQDPTGKQHNICSCPCHRLDGLGIMC